MLPIHLLAHNPSCVRELSAPFGGEAVFDSPRLIVEPQGLVAV